MPKNLSENAIDYLWFWGDGTSSSEFEPEHLYTNQGNYPITLIVFNEAACSDTLSIEVDVNCTNRLLANTFTPNGDGQNNFSPFDALAGCGPMTIRIFNRWGKLVYQSTDPFTPWYGQNVLSGVYYYKIDYPGGQESGYIELIK